MKKLLFIFFVALLAISCNSDTNQGSNNVGLSGSSELTNSMDSMSYAVGNYFSKQFKNLGVKILTSEMARGLDEAILDKAYMDETEVSSFVKAYQMEMRTRKGTPFADGEQLNINLDSLSYAMGADLGSRIGKVDMEFNPSAFMRGAMDIYSEGANLFNDEQISSQIQLFSMEMQKQQQLHNAKLALENVEKGKQFIAEKAKEDGVKSTASGLHYKVIKEGSGAKPEENSTVNVHYHGTLLDGTVFDSSVERGETIEFSLQQVIKGWTEGLQLMSPGSKYQFYIPADLAYGDRGFPPSIGPGETLIFDIELFEIK